MDWSSTSVGLLPFVEKCSLTLCISSSDRPVPLSRLISMISSSVADARSMSISSNGVARLEYSLSADILSLTSA